MSDIDENKIRVLDGSLLLVFRELLRHRRTTLVASRLRVSQSAVSHALARLRMLFDDELFVRRPHGLEPTRLAVELSPRVDELLAGMAGALGLSAAFNPLTTTRGFRIAAPDHFSTLIAPSLLSTFTDAAPQARFAFTQRLGDDALQALCRGEIDVALGRFASSNDAVVVEPIFDDRYCLIGRIGHPRLHGKLTPDLYAELEHVQVSVAGDFRSLEIEVSGRAPARRIVAAVPRFLMAFAVVSRSDAVALAPYRLASSLANEFGLTLHELPFRLAPIRVLAVRRSVAEPGALWLLARIKQAIDMTA